MSIIDYSIGSFCLRFPLYMGRNKNKLNNNKPLQQEPETCQNFEACIQHFYTPLIRWKSFILDR
jgi:hypothetical protein